MKEIKAFIKPHRLDAVLEKLYAHPNLPGVTISQARGFGKTVGRKKEKSGDGATHFGVAEMTKIECVVRDALLEEIIEVIQTAAHTGTAGDGKIFIYDVRELVIIRTGGRRKER